MSLALCAHDVRQAYYECCLARHHLAVIQRLLASLRQSSTGRRWAWRPTPLLNTFYNILPSFSMSCEVQALLRSVEGDDSGAVSAGIFPQQLQAVILNL